MAYLSGWHELRRLCRLLAVSSVEDDCASKKASSSVCVGVGVGVGGTEPPSAACRVGVCGRPCKHCSLTLPQALTKATTHRAMQRCVTLQSARAFTWERFHPLTLNNN